MPRLEFWYDIASNYSYLSAMRIEELAGQAGVTVDWKPFLLGPIFKARGWTSSPFNLFPDKGRNMVRDMERIAGDRGIPFVMPVTFPANSVLAVRIAHALEAEGRTTAFSVECFKATFQQANDISDRTVLTGILSSLGLDATATLARAETDAQRESLRARNQEAQARGIYGSPSFITESGELFWGDDRLEQALRWACHPH
jgi:2-hydroxychromene-2-carboxylate isomerase